MKAAVLYQRGQAPQYADFADPIPENDEQVLVTVKASSIKNLDKGRASGGHYSHAGALANPEVVGFDGVGILANGTRVYSIGFTGMLAEKALVDKSRLVVVPANLDDATAAALPNAVMGAASALHFRAGIVEGETVLINGATGVTGKVAIQIAKHYGAKKVIVTGRNTASFAKLKELGADETVSLLQTDEQLVNQIKELHAATPIDIVIDYIWGHPAELILTALQGNGRNTHHVRVVTVGGMAGDTIQLSSSILRSSDITIMGSGLGSLSHRAMKTLFAETLPEMFQLAAEGKLKMDITTANLTEIATVWNQPVASGERLVILV